MKAVIIIPREAINTHAKFKKTQVEVAQVAKVTEVTIRTRLKDIKVLMDY